MYIVNIRYTLNVLHSAISNIRLKLREGLEFLKSIKTKISQLGWSK